MKTKDHAPGNRSGNTQAVRPLELPRGYTFVPFVVLYFIVAKGFMKAVLRRFASEYIALSQTISMPDFAAVMAITASQAPAILRSKKLTVLDAGMSRDLRVRFKGTTFTVPVAQIDRMLEGTNDNPTFGNIREMYARNCYLENFNLKKPIGAVLDAGANRGLFSLLAFVHLGATKVVGVEPEEKYVAINRLLHECNQIDVERVPRYTKFLVKPSTEASDPSRQISILSLLKEQGIDRFGFVKMDIEGFEKAVFEEPEWLAYTDNIAMELHPHFVGDLSLIPEALTQFGFKYLAMNQDGQHVPINEAMFLQASCVGALN